MRFFISPKPLFWSKKIAHLFLLLRALLSGFRLLYTNIPLVRVARHVWSRWRESEYLRNRRKRQHRVTWKWCHIPLNLTTHRPKFLALWLAFVVDFCQWFPSVSSRSHTYGTMAASASKAFTVSKLDVLASSVSYRSFGTSASAFASPGYSDGGYRTGDDSPSADNPDCSAFSFDEDEVDLFSSELIDEMDNEVFDQETDEEGGDTEGENIEVLRRDVVPLRTRALSFPFTLADVRFSLTFPVASMGYPDSAMKKEFSLKSWWESKSGNCNKQFKGEEKGETDLSWLYCLVLDSWFIHFFSGKFFRCGSFWICLAGRRSLAWWCGFNKLWVSIDLQFPRFLLYPEWVFCWKSGEKYFLALNWSCGSWSHLLRSIFTRDAHSGIISSCI